MMYLAQQVGSVKIKHQKVLSAQRGLWGSGGWFSLSPYRKKAKECGSFRPQANKTKQSLISIQGVGSVAF